MKQESFLGFVTLTGEELILVNGGSEQSHSAGESVGSFAARIANAIDAIIDGIRDAMEYMGEMCQDAEVSSGTITT